MIPKCHDYDHDECLMGKAVPNKVLDREAMPLGPNPYPEYIYRLQQKRTPSLPSIDKWYPFHLSRLELCIRF